MFESFAEMQKQATETFTNAAETMQCRCQFRLL